MSKVTPCDELVTAKIEYKWLAIDGWKEHPPIFEEEIEERRELVTRQNAEEVIAAKDAQLERLADDYQDKCDEISRGWKEFKYLEADNEAKDREIERLTKSLIVEEQINAAKDVQIDEYETGLVQMHQEMSALEADNKRLREALESIANNMCCSGCQEAALVARAALAEVKT